MTSSHPAALPRHFVVLAGSALVLLLLYWAQAVLIPVALAVLFTYSRVLPRAGIQPHFLALTKP